MRRPARGWTLALVGVLFLLALGEGSADARRRRRGRKRPQAARVVRAIAPLTPQGLPNVQSASAVVMNLETGRVLYGKNPHRTRAIASTGKIFVAMVARKRGIDLDGVTFITMDDARNARGGSRTQLDVGESYSNLDLLRAMLIASDNRAVTAVGRGAGLTPEQLVVEMNALARELGLTRTRFTDPTGLNGNWSTAREMAIALRHALDDPVLAEVLGTRYASITRLSHKKPRVLHYANTNRMLHRDRFRTLGGKTGYTRDAGYCLISASQVGGRRLAFIFLGADGELTRFADFNRVWDWMAANGHIPPDPAQETASSSAAEVTAQKAEDSR
jgi:serine-type D-Ala-D-Ala endopeptidase (penicillin-binding protein 7)